MELKVSYPVRNPLRPPETVAKQWALLIGARCHAQGCGDTEQEAHASLLAEATELYIALGRWLFEHVDLEALGRIDSEMPPMASIELRRLTRGCVQELRSISEAHGSESLDDAVERVVRERDEARAELCALKGGK